MRIANEDLIELGTPTDMSASFNSVPMWLGHIVNYSIQLAFSDNPNGTLKLQISDDEGQPTQQPPTAYEDVDNWTDVAGSSQTITASGNHTWEVINTGAQWVRFVWTATSGDGVLDSARMNVKGA